MSPPPHVGTAVLAGDDGLVPIDVDVAGVELEWRYGLDDSLGDINLARLAIVPLRPKMVAKWRPSPVAISATAKPRS